MGIRINFDGHPHKPRWASQYVPMGIQANENGHPQITVTARKFISSRISPQRRADAGYRGYAYAVNMY